ncbi:MAG TPA: AAA family ATPase [Acidimicrobiales bacterium]|nr:AAA family ATPase [Acidimicrobiales bacterium]
MPVDDREVRWRRRKFAQIAAAHGADMERAAELVTVDADRAARIPEAHEILNRLYADGDVQAFQAALDRWSRRPGFSSFGGVNGQMFLNQLVNYTEDLEELARLLSQVLRPPVDGDEARRKMVKTLAFVDQVRRGAHPAPKRVPYVLSFFWSLQDHDRWPCIWTSAEKMLTQLGWLVAPPGLDDLYLQFRDTVLSLGAPNEVEHALSWMENHRFTGLDPALVERCAYGVELNLQRRADELSASVDYEGFAEANSRAVLGDLALLGFDREAEMANAVGRSVKVVRPPLKWNEGVAPYRSDGWIDWRMTGGSAPSVRVWATSEGVAVGLDPGWYREGWYREASTTLAGSLLPSGMQFFTVHNQAPSRLHRRGLEPPDGQFLLGTWFAGGEALDRIDFAEQVEAIAAELQPAVDRLMQAAGDTGTEGPTRRSANADDGLAGKVEQFRREQGYPNEKDRWNRVEREIMAALLAPEELPVLDLGELRSMINTKRYGSPGPQSILNTTLRDASTAEIDRLLATLDFVLWGQGPDEDRIDQALDPDEHGVKGLGEAVIMKLLAIAHPHRYLPVFPFTGDMGKVRLMRLIGLDPPDPGLSRGARQVRANDVIRSRLDRYFPGDPWGQAQFLYWLNSRSTVPPGDGGDLLATLAEELLVDRAFLDDILSLLEDKGQIVLYGPPGTGKTYLARKLAEHLTADPSRRMLVQFHPSTSYEDFFEGYRPEAGRDGQLSYRLTPGPLALLADRAEKASGVPHVMVIDEINRANLPKVFGELLFLLEYRQEPVRTLYRSEEAFELPANLRFIGTMNTADRSIALVDAALRRRFHFIPFFPDRPPMAGLLQRWLEREGEPTEVAELVEMVNADLVRDLGGPHLQLGPSHFMKKGLDDAALRRIWDYNVVPFIEDQFYGEPSRIREYEFDRVMARFRQGSGVDPLAADPVIPDPADEE